MAKYHSEVVQLRVGLLDGDATSRSVTASMLSSCGFMVSELSTAAQLLDDAEKPYELLIIALELPSANGGMDGVSVCRELRAEGFRGPLLTLGARPPAEHERKLLEDCQADFLQKPFGPLQLVNRVRQCIAGGA